MCGRDPSVLEATATFAEKAATLESTSAVAMAELGQQCLLRNRVKDAQRYYKVSIRKISIHSAPIIRVIAIQLNRF